MFRHLDREQAAQHIRVLGWLVLAAGLLGLLGAACAAFGLLGLAATVSEPEARRVLPVVAIGLSGFVGVLSCISLVAGYGLLNRRRWARPVAIVDAFLGLGWFPLGTLYGLYAFWVLFQAESVAYLEAETG